MKTAFKISSMALFFLTLPVSLRAHEIELRLRIADSLFQAEKYAAAESLYTEVLKTAEGIDRGIGLKGLANLALFFGNTEAAEKIYQDALTIFKQAKYANGEAKIYLNLGVIALYQSDYPKAENLLNNALATNGRIKDRTTEEQEDEIHILEMLGQVFMAQDLHGKAIEKFLSAIGKASSISYKKGVVSGYYLLGSLFQQTALVDSALQYYERSCSLSLALGYLKSAFDASRETGNIERKLGRYDQAYENLFRALNLVGSIKSGKEIMLGEGELLYDIGLLYIDMGKAREALVHFHNALKIFEKMKNTGWKIESLQSIGYAYLLMALAKSSYYDSSLYYYKLAKAEITNKKDEAQYYNNLGIVYDGMKNYKAAEDNYNLAREGYAAVKDSVGIARALSNLGNLAMTKGKYEDAINNYQAALGMIANLKRRDWEASLLSNLGYAQHAAGRLDEAIASLYGSVQIIEALRGKITSQEFRSIYLENKITVYEELVDLYCQKGMAQEAFNCAERAKSRAFLDLLSGVSFAKKENLDPVIKSLIEKEQELEKKVEFLTGDPRQSVAIIEHNDVLRELALQYPDYASLKSAKPIDIKGLQDLLDRETAVVEYFIGARNCYIFIVTNQSLSIKKTKATPREIYDNVNMYKKIIHRKVNFPDNDLLNMSDWFFIHLLKPLMPELKGVKRLCIIPYGILHHLPFATIAVSKEPVQLLIDEYDIFYSPSASVYEIAHNKNKNIKKKSVIFAKSQFRDHSYWATDSLPGTRRETDSLAAAKVMPGLRIFSDADSSLPQPSETNAKKFLKDYDIIHLATHGKLAPGDSALESRVILTKDDENDGNLKVREIFDLDLNAYLVTMSACETGQLKGFSEGGYIMGDELTGLSRAFIYAGSPSVIATLWKVADASTALVMTRFYQNLKENDKVKALCDAQRWLMKHQYFNKPIFWAPFVVIGDWR